MAFYSRLAATSIARLIVPVIKVSNRKSLVRTQYNESREH